MRTEEIFREVARKGKLVVVHPYRAHEKQIENRFKKSKLQCKLMTKTIACVKDLLFKSKLIEAAKEAKMQMEWAESVEGILERERILVDLDAVKLHGIQLLRKNNPRAEIIGFLSHINVDLRKNAEELGVKTYSRGEFVKHLTKILAGK